MPNPQDLHATDPMPTPKPTPPLPHQITASVDAPPSLYPLLPELLAGLESLGARPRSILAHLRRAKLPRNPRILELACGKGSVSIALARARNANVLAIDAFEPFIDHARQRAAKLNLSNHILFETADAHAFLRAKPKPADRFDLAVMLNLLPALEAAPLLRRWVAPSGYYIIDDAVRAPLRAPRSTDPDFADVPTAAEVTAALNKLGDTVVHTSIMSPAAYLAMEARLYTTISRNITRLIPQHPRLADALRDYRRRQKESAALLAGPLRGCTWLIRRGR